jgi:hypothetical protein
MQKPIIDLYFPDSSTSGKYPSLMGVLRDLNSFPKRPSNLE